MFDHGELSVSWKAVRSRSATIKALSAAQIASSKTQLDLQISEFSTEELNMPLEEYLKTCPGITAVRSVDGTIQLQKRSSPYPKLEESKRNLQDLLTTAKDGASKGTNTLLFTPCAEPLQDLLTKAKHGASNGENSLLFTPCAEPKLPGRRT